MAFKVTILLIWDILLCAWTLGFRNESISEYSKIFRYLRSNEMEDNILSESSTDGHAEKHVERKYEVKHGEKSFMEKYGHHYKLIFGGSDYPARKRNPEEGDVINVKVANITNTAKNKSIGVTHGGVSNNTLVIVLKNVTATDVNHTSAMIPDLLDSNKTKHVINATNKDGIDITNTTIFRMNATERNQTDIPHTIIGGIDTTNTSQYDISNKTTGGLNTTNGFDLTNSSANVHPKNESNAIQGENLANATSNVTSSTRMEVIRESNGTANNVTVPSNENITKEGSYVVIPLHFNRGNTTITLPNVGAYANPGSTVAELIITNKTKSDAVSRTTSADTGTIIGEVIVSNKTESNGVARKSGGKNVKPKKRIVYKLYKPKMEISDFTNKRKHVAHSYEKKPRHYHIKAAES